MVHEPNTSGATSTGLPANFYDPAEQQFCLGPKLVLQTGSRDMGMLGKTSFCLQSTTDAGVRFVQAHTESGNTKIMTEGCLTIEAGEKGKCLDDIVFIANGSGMSFSADAGTYRVTAEQIVLQADKEIVIDAPSIRIGSQDENGTKDITIAAKNVNADAKGGNIGDTLGTSNFMSVFAGGILGGLAATAAGIAGAAAGAAGAAGLGQDGQSGLTTLLSGTTIQTLNPRLVITPKTAAYILEAGDVSTIISITTGGVTVPAGVFTPGDTVLIYNNSAASQTITQGVSATLRLPGTADTGNRTLQQRGLATVLCIAENEFLITGSGLL